MFTVFFIASDTIKKKFKSLAVYKNLTGEEISENFTIWFFRKLHTKLQVVVRYISENYVVEMALCATKEPKEKKPLTKYLKIIWEIMSP